MSKAVNVLRKKIEKSMQETRKISFDKHFILNFSSKLDDLQEVYFSTLFLDLNRH